jgi:polysaccharide pyruvyl transferase WcaK-like protein
MVVAACEALRAHSRAKIGLVRYPGVRDYPVVSDATMDLSRYFNQGGARGEELRLLVALFGYRSVALLGADVLDGFYSDDAVRLRLRLVELAAKAGTRTCVLGFSFNGAPTDGARARMAALPGNVVTLARDRLSHARLGALRAGALEQAADVAFLLQTGQPDVRAVDLAQWSAAVHARGGRVLGVNLCAMAMGAAGLTPDASVALAHAVLTRLRERYPLLGLLLIPHDVRGDPSDVKLLELLARRLGLDDDDLRMLEPPLSARVVKQTCACIDVAWTGRMHFAIAALGQGVPVVAHEYQDKFAGLFADFGLEDRVWPSCRQPTSDAIADLLSDTLEHAVPLRAQIAARLPLQRCLAERNIRALVA